ncbi:MAG: hypothetical protein IJ794_04525 [Lachnospiraceae bacterium]|nr:hypothetical protein [Lachnospiraceae bacterium]
MGKYDNVDREYFTDPERAAELFSAGVYHWRLHIGREELKTIERTYPSLNSLSDRLERDAIFLCEKQHVKYGLEIETHADYGIPRRFLTYDACEYEREAEEIQNEHMQQRDLQKFDEIKSGMKPSDSYYPVINLLLYLGKGHFRGSETLRELFAVPQKIKPFVFEKIQNYSYALMEAEYVDPEEFRTDLRYFFRAMQCRNDKAKLKALLADREYEHLGRAVQKVIVIHMGIKALIKKVIEEDEEMCKAYRDLIADERAEARQTGIQQVVSCLKKIKDGSSKQELLDEGFDREIVDQAWALML